MNNNDTNNNINEVDDVNENVNDDVNEENQLQIQSMSMPISSRISNINDASNILISILNTFDTPNRIPRRLIYDNSMMNYLNELQNTTNFYTQPPNDNQNDNQNENQNENQTILAVSEEANTINMNINSPENEIENDSDNETSDYDDMPPLINSNENNQQTETVDSDHDSDDDDTFTYRYRYNPSRRRRRLPQVVGTRINLENVVLNNNNQDMMNLLNFLNRTSHYNYRRANSLQGLINSTLYDKPSYKNILSDDGEKELKKIKYRKNSEEFPNEKCPIMHIPFEENEEVTQLPCNHCFDTEAIHKWLKEEKAECPVCRYKLDSKEEKITNENQVEAQTQTPTENQIQIQAERPLSETRTTFFNSLSRLYEHPFGPRNQNRRIIMPTPAQASLNRIASVIHQQDEDAELQEALYASMQNLDISNNN